MNRFALPSVALFALSTSPAGAQSQVATFPGAAPGDHHSVVLGGVDLDGDGFDDLVVGAPDDDTAGAGAGAVYAYSGQTNELLWAQYGMNPIAAFGHALAFAYDMNADGVEEVVVGAPFDEHMPGVYTGAVYALSGVDGSYTVGLHGDNHNDGLGWSVAGSFEWSALPPGHAVFAGGAPFADDDGQGGIAANTGYVKVVSGWFSGAGSAVALEGEVHGDAAGDLFGWSLSGVGDLDFDLADDLAVGAPGADSVKGDVGMVRTYRWGSAYWTRYGLDSGDQMGGAVAPAGDINGDFRDDVLAGEPANADNGPLAGRVSVFSGTSALLGVLRGDGAGDLFGTSLALVDDLSGDGVPDWVIGAPQTGTAGAGYARVFDSVLRTEVFTLHGDAAGDGFGGSVSGAGYLPDLQNTSTPVLAVGAEDHDGPGGGGTGMARLYFGQGPGIVSYCTAGSSAAGCQAQLVASGSPSATQIAGFDLLAMNVEGDKSGLFFFGANGRQAASWGNGSSYQCVVPPVKRGGPLGKTGAPGTCDGSFQQDLNSHWTLFPNKNPGAGAVVQAQLWYRDPQSTSNQTTSLSNAVEFVVCP